MHIIALAKPTTELFFTQSFTCCKLFHPSFYAYNGYLVALLWRRHGTASAPLPSPCAQKKKKKKKMHPNKLRMMVSAVPMQLISLSFYIIQFRKTYIKISSCIWFEVLGWQTTSESLACISATLSALTTEIDIGVLYQCLGPGNRYSLISAVHILCLYSISLVLRLIILLMISPFVI